jgi:hypothetical protein
MTKRSGKLLFAQKAVERKFQLSPSAGFAPEISQWRKLAPFCYFSFPNDNCGSAFRSRSGDAPGSDAMVAVICRPHGS